MIAKGFQSGTQILMLYCTTQLGILHMYIVQRMGQAASPPTDNLHIAGTVCVTNQALSAGIVQWRVPRSISE